MSDCSTSQSARPSHEQVICSLFEGDFHLGLAALMNSIVRGGFSGLFWIGYRGSLPPWTKGLERNKEGLFHVGKALLGFELVKGNRHLGQLKPEFLSQVIDRGIAGKYIWYFDPDITVRCKWEFFEAWVRYGISLCQEITMGTMPSTHPIRCAWGELAREAGWGDPLRQQERYYNSGFVGMDIAHRDFLRQWIAAIRLANRNGVKPDQFQKGGRAQVFFTIDQDTFNIATMYSHMPLSAIGPEGMGFIPGGFIMYHSVGPSKPWRKKFLRSAFRALPPTPADKHFLEYADGPILSYSSLSLKWRRMCAGIAVLVGRFYRRV